MRTLLLALFFSASLGEPEPGPKVVLPEALKGRVGSWIIVSPKQVVGGAVKWRVDPGLQEVDFSGLFPKEVLDKMTGKVVTADTPGKYRVEAWDAKGDVASDIATCWITVGDPLPPPIPPVPVPPGPVPPIPPIPPPGQMATFLVGVTSGDRTLTQATILEDAELLAWLTANKVGWRVFDSQQAGVRQYGLDKILAGANVTAPAVIAWDAAGNTRVASAPGDSNGIKLFVQGVKKLYLGGPGKFDYFQESPDAPKRWLTRIPPPAGQKMEAKAFKDAIGLVPEAQWRVISRRGLFPPNDWILDQQSHGSCVGHGSAGAFRATRFLAGMRDLKLSPNCVYAQINGGADNGAIIGDSLDALQRVGTVTYSTFGDWNKIYLNQLPSGWKTEASRLKVEQAYMTTSFAEIGSAVQLGYTCVFGMMVGNNFDSFDQYGVAGFASGQGNHCLFIDGMTKLPDGRWVLDVVNSWGVSWGPWRIGRCYMDIRHIDRADNSDAYAIKGSIEDPQETVRPPVKL